MVLLCLVAELDQHRTHHHHAEGQHWRRTERGTLVLEDVLLHFSPTGAAQLYRPQRCIPATVIEGGHPVHIVVFAQALAQSTFGGQGLRELIAQEGPHFLTEGQLGRRVLDIHRGIS
ncbi:hypothetical protein D3C81_1970040 [compost metagenome]